MQYTKPYYFLDISIEGASYDLNINGIGLVKDNRPVSIKVALPVNHWLINGDNTIGLELGHVDATGVPEGFDTTIKAKVALMVRQSGDQPENDKLVSLIAFNGKIDKPMDFSANLENSIGGFVLDSGKHFAKSDSGDVIIGNVDNSYNKASKKLALSQGAKLPFPFKWQWSESGNITQDKETFESLWSEYEKLWDSLNSKKIEGLDPLFEERNKELAQAYYTSSEEMMSKLGLKELVVNSELEFFDLEKDDSHLEVLAGGRLARILFWDNAPILFFNYKDGSGSVNIPIVYRRQNDKWIICR